MLVYPAPARKCRAGRCRCSRPGWSLISRSYMNCFTAPRSTTHRDATARIRRQWAATPNGRSQRIVGKGEGGIDTCCHPPASGEGSPEHRLSESACHGKKQRREAAGVNTTGRATRASHDQSGPLRPRLDGLDQRVDVSRGREVAPLNPSPIAKTSFPAMRHTSALMATPVERYAPLAPAVLARGWRRSPAQRDIHLATLARQALHHLASMAISASRVPRRRAPGDVGTRGNGVRGKAKRAARPARRRPGRGRPARQAGRPSR